MKKQLLALAITLLISTVLQAQNVGINTATPHASAALDVSSTTAGFLVPRMTQTERDAITIPKETGLLLYQTDNTPGFYYWNGTAWTPFVNGGSSFTASYVSASNTASTQIAVVLGGTDVPLPNNQNMNGIMVNGSNTIFTVAAAGTYKISYSVNLTATSFVSSRVIINGSAQNNLTVNSLIGLSQFHAETIVTLSAGSTLSLQLFAFIGPVTLTSGQGAALNVVRIN